MSYELWASYNKSLKLILTGSTTKALSRDQRTIYTNMLSKGLRDNNGARAEMRNLLGVNMHEICVDENKQQFKTLYYIPDLFRFMIEADRQWGFYSLPVDLDYLKSLKDDDGSSLFCFDGIPSKQEWLNTPKGKNYWDLLCEKVELMQKITRLECSNDGGNASEMEAQDRLGAKWTDRLTIVNKELIEIDNKEQTLDEDIPVESGKNTTIIPELEPHTLEVFRSMDNLKFQEIKIKIDPDHLVLKISARDKNATAPFSTFDLTKKNTITLNRQGELFMQMANKVTNLKMPGTSNAIPRLSASLRKAFNTPDTPFLNNKPIFNLNIPKDKLAKRKASKRTSTYDDNRNAKSFLEQHDPHYDPDNSIYSEENDQE